MFFNYNQKYKNISKIFRKNMTPEERHLWYDFLKRLPVTVHRQKIIGDFIVDFFISSKNVVIEIDGLQHSMPENKISDEQRDRELKLLGIDVLRYKNNDINKNFHMVCEDILKHLEISPDQLKKE